MKKTITCCGKHWIRETVFTLLIIFNLHPFSVSAQNHRTPNRDDYVLHIKKARAFFQIDGQLDETDCQTAEIARDLWRVLPIDTGQAATLPPW